MNHIKQSIVSVLTKDKYNRDIHGLGVILGMVIKNFLTEEEGNTKSDFLKGINEGLSKDPEKIKTA